MISCTTTAPFSHLDRKDCSQVAVTLNLLTQQQQQQQQRRRRRRTLVTYYIPTQWDIWGLYSIYHSISRLMVALLSITGGSSTAHTPEKCKYCIYAVRETMSETWSQQQCHNLTINCTSSLSGKHNACNHDNCGSGVICFCDCVSLCCHT